MSITHFERQSMFMIFHELRTTGQAITRGHGRPCYECEPFQIAIVGLVTKRFLIQNGVDCVVLSDKGLAYMRREILALPEPHEDDEYQDWHGYHEKRRLIQVYT